MFEFCYRAISIFRTYFGKVDEESVKNNFMLIDELIDGAFPLYSAVPLLHRHGGMGFMS